MPCLVLSNSCTVSSSTLTWVFNPTGVEVSTEMGPNHKRAHHLFLLKWFLPPLHCITETSKRRPQNVARTFVELSTIPANLSSLSTHFPRPTPRRCMNTAQFLEVWCSERCSSKPRMPRSRRVAVLKLEPCRGLQQEVAIPSSSTCEVNILHKNAKAT